MKKVALYILLLAAAVLAPLRGMDVGKLQPVGLVQLYKEGETVVIVTDTGDSGRGNNVEAAFENLEDTTPGVIFLDTADYLLISKDAVGEVEKLSSRLKASVRLCYAEKDIEAAEAMEYLAVHRPQVLLKESERLADAETLMMDNERLVLK